MALIGELDRIWFNTCKNENKQKMERLAAEMPNGNGFQQHCWMKQTEMKIVYLFFFHNFI